MTNQSHTLIGPTPTNDDADDAAYHNACAAGFQGNIHSLAEGVLGTSVRGLYGVWCMV